MDGSSRKKSVIDVMENVFGGIRISTEDEVRGQEAEPDLRSRRCLAGLTVTAVEVGRAKGDDDEPKER